MDKNICDKIIEEIKNLPAGTTFTIKEFLDKHNIDKDFQLRFDYTSAIKKEVRDYIEICDEDKDSFIGPPFVVRFVKK